MDEVYDIYVTAHVDEMKAENAWLWEQNAKLVLEAHDMMTQRDSLLDALNLVNAMRNDLERENRELRERLEMRRHEEDFGWMTA